MKILKNSLIVLLCMVCLPAVAQQTNIRIIAPQKGFPIAVPQFCDAGSGGAYTSNISSMISKNLTISGLFRVIEGQGSTTAKCPASSAEGVEQWTSLGAEGVVKGSAQMTGVDKQFLTVELYLYDVIKKKAVIGKSYEIRPEQFPQVAYKFSDEIIQYFSGQRGIFSTKIAYVSEVGKGQEVFLMDLNGQNVTQLTKDGAQAAWPSWSPSADHLIFTSTRLGLPDLFSITLKNKIVRQVTGLPGEERAAKYAPDGKSILSTAFVSGKYSIVLFNLRGRLLQNLTPYTAMDISASWSPDGREVAFCSDQGGKPQVYVMPVKGGAAHRISYANRENCYSPAWSPKGDAIAFVCKDQKGSQIFSASPSGTDVVQLTFQGNNEDPSWAPNGNILVYSTDFGNPQGARQLALFSMTSGTTQQLTFNKSGVTQPAWSPWIKEIEN